LRFISHKTKSKTFVANVLDVITLETKTQNICKAFLQKCPFTCNYEIRRNVPYSYWSFVLDLHLLPGSYLTFLHVAGMQNVKGKRNNKE